MNAAPTDQLKPDEGFVLVDSTNKRISKNLSFEEAKKKAQQVNEERGANEPVAVKQVLNG